jgi:hypothetical protein
MSLGVTDRLPATTYEIRIEGELDESWEEWFSSLAVSVEYNADQPPTTTLTGAVADQSALRGTLCRLWDLNLNIISVRRIDEEKGSG